MLKKALKDERKQKEEFKKDAEHLKKRNDELEKENEANQERYLKLYDENDKLSELIQTLQHKLANGGVRSSSPEEVPTKQSMT